MRNVVIKVCVCAVLPLLVLSLVCVSHPKADVTPEDDVLRDRFETDRKEFRELSEMILDDSSIAAIGRKYVMFEGEDSAGRGCSYWLMSGRWRTRDESEVLTTEDLLRKWGLPEVRWEDYQSRLTRIGAVRVSRNPVWLGTPSVSFTVHLGGRVLVSSESKAIVFCPNGLPFNKMIVDDTDKMPDESDWFSPLGDGWYIHHSRT